MKHRTPVTDIDETAKSSGRAPRPVSVSAIDDTGAMLSEYAETHEHDPSVSAELSAGDLDARWDQAESGGEETAGGSAPTPDQDVVDEIGKAVGVTYMEGEPLRVGRKEMERDEHRWELDPASAEDYLSRSVEGAGPKPARKKQNKDQSR